MDRTYVGRHQVVPVHQLGLNLWRDVVVRAPRLQERLSSTLLALVARERAGEIIDRALMRSVTMVRPGPGAPTCQPCCPPACSAWGREPISAILPTTNLTTT